MLFENIAAQKMKTFSIVKTQRVHVHNRQNNRTVGIQTIIK